MKTVSDFLKHYRPTDIPSKAFDCMDIPIESVWHEGKPALVVWIATKVGVLSNERLRAFAMWSVIQLEDITKDFLCHRALKLCRNYFDNPFPEDLRSNMDLTLPSHARFLLEVSKDSEVSKAIFDIAEFQHKKWSRSTALEDAINGAVHSAVCTLSEAHCSEMGQLEKSGFPIGPANSAPAIVNADDLSLGISVHAYLAAYCARNALGEAAKEVFFQSHDYDLDPDEAGEEAAAAAESAQAIWLRENTTPVFPF